MKLNFVFISVSLILIHCKSNDMSHSANPKIKVQYPVTKTEDVKDDYHGKNIADPYRWLENDTATATEAWVKEQNKVTADYLAQIPYRDSIKKRYSDLYNYVKLSSPRKAGEYYFYYKNDGLQNQAIIYYQKGSGASPLVFIDPNKLSANGTASISLLGASRDDKYLAYARQNAGSDWQEIHVREIATNKEMPDVIKWVKFSGASWDDNGFYLFEADHFKNIYF